jgi:hypothetical protein
MKYKAVLSVVFIFLTIQIFGQDNRVSIDEELRKIWGADQSSNGIDMGGMFDTPVETNNTFDDNVIDAPIDGGLGFLMAAGVLYGTRRLRRKASKA